MIGDRIPSRFHNRRALVTGAGSGIGAAVAQRLANEGAVVVAVDIDAGRLQSLYPDNSTIMSFASDVRNTELADYVGEHDFDIIVNAAGVLRRAAFLEHDLDDWNLTFDVNVKAVFRLNRAFAARHIRRATAGVIINVCSIESFTTAADHAAYTASKTALAALTKATALELADYGIRVNAIAPGVTETRMNEALRSNEERSEGLKSKIPMRRFGTPDEQAAAIAFLASEDASYITGAIIPVDGGWLCE